MQEQFGGRKNYHYVHFFGGKESDVEELYCMSAYKHHILTNKSSYGWWASWLSPYKDGINVVKSGYVGDEVRNCSVLDEDRIESLFARYIEKSEQCDVMGVNIESLQCLLGENQNEQVIRCINDAMINSCRLTKDESLQLLECKGIAYIQIGRDYARALSFFHELQQTQRDNWEFSYNYSMALSGAGRYLEGAIIA